MRRANGRPPVTLTTAVPAVDVAETDKAYEIAAELPGMAEKDVEVKLANEVLTIKGEKQEEKEEKKTGYHVSERRYGAFQRSFRILDGVDKNKLEASFKNGVLKVTLPKTKEAQRAVKKIDVKAGWAKRPKGQPRRFDRPNRGCVPMVIAPVLDTACGHPRTEPACD
jgi:HSP20 family molecular chaperone IbpA